MKGLFGSPSPEQKAEQQRQHDKFWNGVGSAIKATKKHWEEKGKAIGKAINTTIIMTEAASNILKTLFGPKKASKPVQLLKSTSPPPSTHKVTPTTAAPEVDHDIEENLDNDSDRDDDDDEDSEPLDSSGVSEQTDSEYYYYYDDDSDSYETEEYE